MAAVHAVILAGGSGTRFWPASRRLTPKQLLPIAPNSHHSLIASTLRRVAPLADASRVLVATGAHLVDATRRALPELPEGAFLGEPAARNTAPCIGWASAIVSRADPDALIMVLPSDQHIGDEPAFLETLELALSSAASGTITTIGITPTRPETGYGYIEAGEQLGPRLRRVTRFVEKPDRARAEDYLRSGNYYWNSGMFFFKAGSMLAAIEEHMPELWAGLMRIEAAAAAGPEEERAVTNEVFPTLPSTSIDYGIMEKMPALNVVPGSFGWSDLGSWESAWELAERDADGNAAPEHAVLVDAQRNLVSDLRTGDGRVIALVGVSDLCVIETDDALLVIPRERAQDVRLAVDALKARGYDSKL